MLRLKVHCAQQGSSMEPDRDVLKTKDIEFRVALVDGHEFIRPARAAPDVRRQVLDLLKGGYVREVRADGSITFHLTARVASITAQRKGTGVVEARKGRSRSR